MSNKKNSETLFKIQEWLTSCICIEENESLKKRFSSIERQVTKALIEIERIEEEEKRGKQ